MKIVKIKIYNYVFNDKDVSIFDKQNRSDNMNISYREFNDVFTVVDAYKCYFKNDKRN